MKSMRILLTAFVVAATLGGCAEAPPANQAMLTYKTKPEGAQLMEGSLVLGIAPVTRTYKGDGKSTSITTPDVTAVWPSGAKTTFFTILEVGADRVATLERPADAPGLQVDLDNAKKILAAQELEERRRKEDIARDMSRNSDRCKAQLAKGGTPAVDDCQ